MATALEITLSVVVAALVIAMISVWACKCRRGRNAVSGARPLHTASAQHSWAVDDKGAWATVNAAAIPARHRTLEDLKPSSARGTLDGAHMHTIPDAVDQETGVAIVPAGNTSGDMAPQPISEDAFETFEDAPPGTNPSMWGSGAEAGPTGPEAALPAGAKTREEVRAGIFKAAGKRLADRIESHLGMRTGTRALSRQVGATSGLNMDVVQEFFCGTKPVAPKIDCDNILKGALNVPQYHPCFYEIQQQLDAERMAGELAPGPYSTVYRNFNVLE